MTTTIKAAATSGPWLTSRYNGGDYAVYAVGRSQDVALIRDNGDGTTEHNAILIAAAPDLLKALKDARKAIADILDNCPYFFPSRGDCSLLSDEQKAWRAKVATGSVAARAAIAAAEGGAQ